MARRIDDDEHDHLTPSQGAAPTENSRAAAIAAARASLPRGCPLHVRSNGQWARKVRGTAMQFGSVRKVTLDQALEAYFKWASDIAAGRDPSAIDQHEVTVGEVFEAFIGRQLRRAETGGITEKTVEGYMRHLKWAGVAIGIERRVDGLGAGDFAQVMDDAEAEGWSPTTVGNMVNAVRAAFLWADDVEMAAPPRYGRRFRKPSKAAYRRFAATRGRQGRRTVTAEEIRATLEHASPVMRVAILLGISAGFGQLDVSELPKSAIDLRGGWIDWPRPKTGIARRCPIWPELTEAIRDWRKAEPKTRERGCGDLLLVNKVGKRLVERQIVTTAGGKPKKREVDSVGSAWSRLAEKVGIREEASDAPGLGFYCLRHTFATVADGARDRMAKAAIMGHAIDSQIDDAYIDFEDDARLEAVSNHVRTWLWPDLRLESPSSSSSREAASEDEPSA